VGRSALGGTVVRTEAVPVTATDYSAYAAKAMSARPDYIVDGMTADMYTKLIKGVRQQGGKLKFLVSAGAFDANQLQRLFPGDSNFVLVEEVDHSSAGYQQFLGT
jgi:ABC-type branched-subunit amino acid transport system substrate-binding protein